MKQIYVSAEAHAAAKEAAAAAGVGMGEWASDRLMAPREAELAYVRELEDELRQLRERPVGIIPNIQPRVEPECRCDGPDALGPHHKPGCHRRTA